MSNPMTDALVVSASGTPIERAGKGSLVEVDAFELAENAEGASNARLEFEWLSR